MDTNRTVVLENVGDCPIGLADTQQRMYRLAKGAKMRISAVTLLDILDHPGSRILFKEGMAKVSNITREELYNMGLNEDEINKYLIEEPKVVVSEPEPVVVVTPDMETVEEVIPAAPVDEEVIEQLKEEITEQIIKEIKPEVAEEEAKVAPKKVATKKAPAKKSTKKSTSKASK